ncbi:alpha/beta hydrolase [Adhaeribacter sp. BT258]|uniref:Alpha/beta hydrolase n=1 Tax=Adhaeribacter terrigena TaxID=2793070 RepID=A0ABS1C544_9BACT|nr:alpha/beta hydrolase-fold protein [Adhaeribacter terrigena]MBK0404506.1 alpha/beta hydrolase [Adhaeribacter terrigena]
MKRNAIILILLFFTNFILRAQHLPEISKKAGFTIGETLTFRSPILNEDREINVYLPEGYAANGPEKYPVIYLLDGSRDEDFIHVAGLVQFGSFPWIQMLPPTIVVGISNVNRKRDYTFPTTVVKDKADFPTTGSSEKFIRFLEQELQPFVNRQYLTNNSKTIIGQSLGGLLATEILFKRPDLFDQYIIVSPSLWWDNESLLKVKPHPQATRKAIYIAVGKEGEVMERTAKELYEKLKPQHKAPLHYTFLAEQDHGDALHLGVYKAFEQLFRTKK